jgi:acyl-[acyl-carrier-protein]-phospholipid O-acyltransferase/long-chain-fatty-acid--[acyl-carrier-protein] ligase
MSHETINHDQTGNRDQPDFRPLPPSSPTREWNDGEGPTQPGGFWSLVVTQFQGAFNDNALKFLVIYLIVDKGLATHQRDLLVLVIGALFALPFILFSMTGGYLADRFSKRSVTIGAKYMELGVMTFALVALWGGNLMMEAAGVFLLSSQAALFGPSKYGLLPELLAEKDLSWGNGIIELGTFLASITATIAAGYLAYWFRGQQHWSGIVLLSCTIAGLAASMGISRVPAANPARKFDYNPLGDLFRQFRLIREDRVLEWAVIGNMYLWFLAALLQFTIVIYGHDILRIDERHISYLQAGVAIGIGLGSLATGYLSGGKIEIGLIPLGAAGMTVFGFLSAGSGLSLLRVGVYLGLLGFFGGFYAVPLNALIQHRPDPHRKGGIIAAANLLSFVGVFLAAGAYFFLAEDLHLGADRVFFAGACMTLAATFYAVVLQPRSVVRLTLWLATHTLYRLRVDGRDDIPERGGALFVAGDLTLVEVLLLTAATDRDLQFLMSGARPGPSTWLERILRITRFSGTATAANRQALDEALHAAATGLLCGKAVCLAGPGMLDLLKAGSPQRARLEELLESTRAPMVRVRLTGATDGGLRADNGHLSCRLSVPWLHRVEAHFSSPDAI